MGEKIETGNGKTFYTKMKNNIQHTASSRSNNRLESTRNEEKRRIIYVKKLLIDGRVRAHKACTCVRTARVWKTPHRGKIPSIVHGKRHLHSFYLKRLYEGRGGRIEKSKKTRKRRMRGISSKHLYNEIEQLKSEEFRKATKKVLEKMKAQKSIRVMSNHAKISRKNVKKRTKTLQYWLKALTFIDWRHSNAIANRPNPLQRVSLIWLAVAMATKSRRHLHKCRKVLKRFPSCM